MIGSFGMLAIALVSAVTLMVSALGLRLSRTTSDFYVAGRTVSPGWNASAIGGEYLSAASFLGVAGLVYTFGPDMLWFPVGYTAGFVLLLVLVAAPLRRSGAYTLPDFAEARLESRWVRRITAALVVVVGWIYLIPQFEAAGMIVSIVAGAPGWIGVVISAVVVLASVLSGGMRSITFVQGVQYWIKLTALAIPAFLLYIVWLRHGQPSPAGRVGDASDWGQFMAGAGGREHPLYVTYSTLLGLCLGTMGLPHVVVRFYTNPDGRAARRTTVIVIGLLGMFYAITPLYAVLGRAYLPMLPADRHPESVTLLLPTVMAPGPLGIILTAVLTAGAFAASLSTASGLAIAVAGVIDQDILGRRIHRWTGIDATPVQGFRIALAVAVLAPFVVSLLVPGSGVADTVGIAFAVAASTFCPLLVLGVWWRRLTVPGAAAALVVGGTLSLGAALAKLTGLTGQLDGWPKALIEQPAAWSVPAAFLAGIVVSRLTPRAIPRGVDKMMTRLHVPEDAPAHPGG